MFKAIGRQFKKMLSSLWKWIKKHWKEIVAAVIAIVVVVIAAVYVLPALKAFFTTKILALDSWFGSKFGLASGTFGLSKLFGLGTGTAAAATIGASAGAKLAGSASVAGGIMSKVTKMIKSVGGVISDNKEVIGGIGLAGLLMQHKSTLMLIILVFIGIKLLGKGKK